MIDLYILPGDVHTLVMYSVSIRDITRLLIFFIYFDIFLNHFYDRLKGELHLHLSKGPLSTFPFLANILFLRSISKLERTIHFVHVCFLLHQLYTFLIVPFVLLLYFHYTSSAFVSSLSFSHLDILFFPLTKYGTLYTLYF